MITEAVNALKQPVQALYQSEFMARHLPGGPLQNGQLSVYPVQVNSQKPQDGPLMLADAVHNFSTKSEVSWYLSQVPFLDPSLNYKETGKLFVGVNLFVTESTKVIQQA